MIRNILIIIATLFICFLVGLTIGSMLGILLGGIPALLFREIINSNQTTLMSITLILIQGVLLGFFAMHLANNIFDAKDKPLIGVLLGILVGLFVVFFFDGVINIYDPESFKKSMIIPIIYSGKVGAEIGVIIFPIIGTKKIIRDILANKNAAKINENGLVQMQKFFRNHLSNKDKHD